MDNCCMKVFASVVFCLIYCSSCLPCNPPPTASNDADTTECGAEYRPAKAVYQLQHGIEAGVLFAVSCLVHKCMYHVCMPCIKMGLVACFCCEKISHQYLYLHVV